jgi:hypothetical protein
MIIRTGSVFNDKGFFLGSSGMLNSIIKVSGTVKKLLF